MEGHRSLAVGALIAAGALVAAAGGLGAPSTKTLLRAKLGVRQEVPRPQGTKAGATGLFTATLVRKHTATLRWKLTFRKLTGKATVAAIHVGRAGKAAPAAIGLCKPCRSPVSGIILNPRPALVKALLHRRAYVNVRTRRNRAGEIRGQIVKAGG
jgi:hypothetical protein